MLVQSVLGSFSLGVLSIISLAQDRRLVLLCRRRGLLPSGLVADGRGTATE
jgi:hypothetical protein